MLIVLVVFKFFATKCLLIYCGAETELLNETLYISRWVGVVQLIRVSISYSGSLICALPFIISFPHFQFVFVSLINIKLYIITLYTYIYTDRYCINNVICTYFFSLLLTRGCVGYQVTANIPNTPKLRSVFEIILVVALVMVVFVCQDCSILPTRAVAKTLNTIGTVNFMFHNIFSSRARTIYSSNFFSILSAFC